MDVVHKDFLTRFFISNVFLEQGSLFAFHASSVRIKMKLKKYKNKVSVLSKTSHSHFDLLTI